MNMQIAPYSGNRRVLHTHLSAKECVRRLRDNVERNAVFGQISNWALLTRDNHIMRKIDGNKFSLYKYPRPIRGVTWTLDGEIEEQGEGTVINCRYSLDFWYQTLLVFGLGIPAFIIAYIVYRGLTRGLATDVILSSAATFAVVLICLLGLLIWRNNVERANEEHIVRFLREYLNATEVPQ